jgi:hypothetical protein
MSSELHRCVKLARSLLFMCARNEKDPELNCLHPLYRATFGGPNSITGDKFRTKDEFKKDIGQNSYVGRTLLFSLLLRRC